jgi:hypothetical protein
VSEERSPREQALDLLFYAPLGLALSVDELLPELAAKGRQHVAVARVFGQLAVQQGPGAASRALARLEEKAAVLEERAAAIITALLTADEQRADLGEGVTESWVPEPRAQAELEAAIIRRPRDLATAAGAAALARADLDAGAVVGPARLATGRSDAPGDFEAPAAEASAGGRSAGAATQRTPGATRSAAPKAGPAATARNGSARRSSRPVLTAEPADVTTLAIPDYESLSASQVVPRLAGLTPAERAAVGQFESAHRGRRTILNRIAQLDA